MQIKLLLLLLLLLLLVKQKIFHMQVFETGGCTYFICYLLKDCYLLTDLLLIQTKLALVRPGPIQECISTVIKNWIIG